MNVSKRWQPLEVSKKFFKIFSWSFFVCEVYFLQFPSFLFFPSLLFPALSFSAFHSLSYSSLCFPSFLSLPFLSLSSLPLLSLLLSSLPQSPKFSLNFLFVGCLLYNSRSCSIHSRRRQARAASPHGSAKVCEISSKGLFSSFLCQEIFCLGLFLLCIRSCITPLAFS